MSNKVDLIHEIYTRLNTARGTGGALATVKRIIVAPRSEIRKGNDYPTVAIWLSGGEEINYQQNNIKTDSMTIEISLLVARLDPKTDNHLFNKTAGTGALYLWENVLNTLDKTTAGAIDLTFSGKANDLPAYNYTVEYQETTIEFTLELEIQSGQFTVGSR